MRQHRKLALGVAAATLLGGTLAGAATGLDVRAAGPCDTTHAAISTAEQQMLDLVNATRAANGLPALKLSPALSRAAAWKSADPSAVGAALSHTDSIGRTAGPRLRDCGYPAAAWGEIIAYVSAEPLPTLNAWMASPGHRAQILEARFAVAGIGAAGRAWTIDFGAYDDSAAGTPPPVATFPALPPATPAAPTPPRPPVTPAPATHRVFIPILAGDATGDR